MASTITGSGMAAALKQQSKAVRAAVERRDPKGREKWRATFTLWSNHEIPRALGSWHEQPSIRPADRHAIANGNPPPRRTRPEKSLARHHAFRRAMAKAA